VFVTVVPDPVRNCVAALAAHVSSREGEDTVVAYPQRLPRNSPQLENQERALLFRFFKKLGQVIKDLKPDISNKTDPDGRPYGVEEGFPHLYVFTEGQPEALMNAVRRHEKLREADAVRSLLGLRGAIASNPTTKVPDQEMVSVLSRELRQRFEMRFIGLGLIQTVAQFWDGNDWFGWDVAPYGQHGPEPSLTEIFAADLFELEVNYTNSGGSLSINHTGSPGVLSGSAQAQFGSSYPMANRHETSLPAAYIWAERDRLTPKWANTPDEEAAIQRYRYHTDSHTDRITQADIESLLERMAASLAHIERGLEVPANRHNRPDAGKDVEVPKVPLDVSQLTRLSQGRGSLASTVQEYALLEHDASEKRAIYKYRQPLDERVQSGHSLVFEATNAWEDDSGRFTNYYLEGEIINATNVGAGGCSARNIPLSVEEGDWMVLTELDEQISPPRMRPLETSWGTTVNDRAKIIHSTVVSIEHLSKSTGQIRLNCMDTSRWLTKDSPCVTWHRSPVVENGLASGPRPSPAPEVITTVLQAGRHYVLDGFADSIDKMRAFPALDAAANAAGGPSGNSLYDHINDLYNR
jgi:uncharacterized protein